MDRLWSQVEAWALLGDPALSVQKLESVLRQACDRQAAVFLEPSEAPLSEAPLSEAAATMRHLPLLCQLLREACRQANVPVAHALLYLCRLLVPLPQQFPAHLLVASGNTRIEDEGDPLWMAATHGNHALLSLVLENQCYAHVDQRYGTLLRTPLMACVHGRHFECARLLVRYGADPLLCDREENNAFAYAEQHLRDDLVLRKFLGLLSAGVLPAQTTKPHSHTRRSASAKRAQPGVCSVPTDATGTCRLERAVSMNLEPPSLRPQTPAGRMISAPPPPPLPTAPSRIDTTDQLLPTMMRAKRSYVDYAAVLRAGYTGRSFQLRVGDEVTVLAQFDNGWSFGQVATRRDSLEMNRAERGWFPTAYCECDGEELVIPSNKKNNRLARYSTEFYGGALVRKSTPSKEEPVPPPPIAATKSILMKRTPSDSLIGNKKTVTLPVSPAPSTTTSSAVSTAAASCHDESNSATNVDQSLLLLAEEHSRQTANAVVAPPSLTARGLSLGSHIWKRRSTASSASSGSLRHRFSMKTIFTSDPMMELSKGKPPLPPRSNTVKYSSSGLGRAPSKYDTVLKSVELEILLNKHAILMHQLNQKYKELDGIQRELAVL